MFQKMRRRAIGADGPWQVAGNSNQRHRPPSPPNCWLSTEELKNRGFATRFRQRNTDKPITLAAEAVTFACGSQVGFDGVV
jgi:hypothetical protein